MRKLAIRALDRVFGRNLTIFLPFLGLVNVEILEI